MLRIALQSSADLQYLDYGKNENGIVLGGLAGAARKEGCLSLPKEDNEFWGKFNSIDSQLKLRQFIDSYKKR